MKGGLLRDSYSWILTHDDFLRWRKGGDFDSRLLWIKADPGKGKTMMLCGIINELDPSDPTHLVSFFFCQTTDIHLNNAIAVLRGLLFQLIDKWPSLVPTHTRDKYDLAGKGLFEDQNAWTALCDILTEVLQDLDLPPTTLIIDALDECETHRDYLLKFIVEFIENHPNSRVKWAVSSRNWPYIEEELDTTHKVCLCLELNRTCISAAVDSYIGHKVNELAKQKRYTSAVREAVHSYLANNAEGTFLWVALVCEALGDSKTRKWNMDERLSERFPSGLDSLYDRMIDQAIESRTQKEVLATMSIVYRPLSLKELPYLVKSLQELTGDPESFEEIIRSCGSFLTVQDGYVSSYINPQKTIYCRKQRIESSIHA